MFLTLSIAIKLLFIFLIFVIQFYWKRRRLYQLARKIPGHDGLPLIGKLLMYMKIDKKNFFHKTLALMDPNSTLTKIWLGPKLLLITEDPETIHTIFNSPHCLNKPELFYNNLLVTKGLLPLTGELYPKHRKILNKAFVPAILQKIQPIVDAKCKRMVTKIEDVLCKEINIMEYVGPCALEAFATGQLGYLTDFYGSTEVKMIESAMDLAMERMSRPWFYFLPKIFYNMTQISKDSQFFLDFGSKLRNVAIENYKRMKIFDYKSIENRVIDLLLDPKYEFSEIEIRDEFVIFVIGSYDTTARSASTAILLLAQHQDCQKKILKEINEICGQNENFTIDADFLKKFEYLDLVVKETLRIFPVGPTAARTVDEEIDVGGYRIPKGTAVLMSLINMHRNPKHWGNDAHLFRPERFLDESINLRAFAPFTGGKRICIGYRYADMLMKTLLINFFRSFYVETSLKFEDLTYTSGVTLTIDQGYMVTVKKRNGMEFN